jgi:hypothetical protein
MDYLKDKREYIDRYDLWTIEECLKWYWDLKDNFQKHRKNKEFIKYSDEEFDEEVGKVLYRFLLTVKTQRFENKQKTIEKWIDDDKRLQDKQDNTQAPENIKCPICGRQMELTIKGLHNTYGKDPKMWFMFECKKCNKRRSVNEDGSEWKYEKPKCPKCKAVLKTENKYEGEIATFIEECPKCGYKNVDVSDHKKWKREQEAKEKRNKELLEKYREEFCLSEEKGKEMVELMEVLAFAHEVREFEASKYDDPAFEKAATINKIGIAEVEKTLGEVLEKESYTKFSTDKPEIDRYVIVPFSLQDGDSLRNRRDTLRELEKLICKTLEGTNWRLLSGSLMNRLGFISGRLKGYEQEEDLQEICGYKKEKEKKKLDPEKLAKYGSNNMVQLEKMLGEHDGVENMRKRRLVKEPNGFLLDNTGSSYTCTICHEQSPTGETWWLPDALWCKECKRNIDEGAIPKLFYFEDKHDKNWFTGSDIKYDYDLKTPTIRKLERNGLLHPRNLKNSEGWVYCSVYLVKENKEFFETHQKVKKIYPKTVTTNSKSEEIVL